MAVTIDMILEKEFKIKVKGYDQVEVDNFLDEICDTLAAMDEEKKMLQSRLEQASRAPAPAPAPVPAPAVVPVPAPIPAPAPVAVQPKAEEPSESAQKLLARAQKIYDEMIADAQAEADEIIRNAKATADASILNLEEEKQALQQEVDMLKAAAQDYKERFLRRMEDQKHILNAENQLFE